MRNHLKTVTAQLREDPATRQTKLRTRHCADSAGNATPTVEGESAAPTSARPCPARARNTSTELHAVSAFPTPGPGRPRASLPPSPPAASALRHARSLPLCTSHTGNLRRKFSRLRQPRFPRAHTSQASRPRPQFVTPPSGHQGFARRQKRQ